jgi:hypothetical protein
MERVEQALQACGKEVAEIGFSRCGKLRHQEEVHVVPQRLKPVFFDLYRRPEGLLHPHDRLLLTRRLPTSLKSHAERRNNR